MKKIYFLFLVFIFAAQFINGQWQQTSSGLTSTTVYGLTLDDSYIYAATSGAGVFRSSDNGSNWTAVNNGITGIFAWEIASINNSLFTGIYLGGTFRSTDYGENWTELTLGSGVGSARDFILHNSYIFTNTWSNGVYRSSDNGDNWAPVNNGLNSGGGWDMLSSGSYLFCCNGFGVYRSIDDGDNWTLVNNGLTSTTSYRMIKSGSYIFVGTYGGIFRSSDYGDNWEPVGLSSSTIYALISYESNIFAGSSNSGVYISSDNGNNWTAINEGLTNQGILCLAIDETYLYTGTGGSGVFRRGIDNILSVKTISDEGPSNFELFQNYPNPFNPTTKISWQSPISSHQTLKVYDVLGNEIATLVDEYKPAGHYEVEFSSKGGSTSGGNDLNLSSGVYFYTFQAGSYSQTKKLVLLK